MSATDCSSDIQTTGASDEGSCASDVRRHRRYNRCRCLRHEESEGHSWLFVSKEVDKLECNKQCRICHLKADRDEDCDDDVVVEEIGEPMELGCDCKGDLATVHMKCAVTWFLIKGDLTCEICGAIVQNVCEMARNVALQQIQEVNHDDVEIPFLKTHFPVPYLSPKVKVP